jgi:hypothetical protein
MNKSLGAHYLKLSADQGDSNAQLKYGTFLLFGEGVQKSESLGAHYLKLSADQGNAEAQYVCGYYRALAEGVPMDQALAQFRFRMRSRQDCDDEALLKLEEQIARLGHSLGTHESVGADDRELGHFGLSRDVVLLTQEIGRENRQKEEKTAFVDAFGYHLMMDRQTDDL